MKVTIERNEYDFLVWLAMLGGIQKLLKSYISYATNGISKQVFKNSILGDLFFIKDRQANDVEGERIETDAD